MQAAFQRTLKRGTEYDRYFPLNKLEHTDPVVIQDGDTFDTIDLMAKLARQYQSDTASLAPTLKGKDLETTCRNIWNFAYSHFQYTPDKSGVEQLRRPLRSWEERTAGIDCDCYSILVSTILLNLGITHKLRKTKYDGKAEYQHIYVVVPKTSGSGYFTIDPVTDKFDKEVPFSAHFDKPMSVQVLNGLPQQVLNGAPVATAASLVPQGAYAAFGLGAEFIGLSGEANQVRKDALATIRTTALQGLGRLAGSDVLGTSEQLADLASVTGQTDEEAAADSLAISHTSASFIERLRQYLFNTAEQIDSYKQKDPEVVVLGNRIKLILSNWDNEAERTRLFDELGEAEEKEYQAGFAANQAVRLNGLGGLNGFFSAIGDAFSSVGSAVGQAASWVGNGVKNGVVSAAQGVAQAGNWTYGTVIKPVGQAVAQAASWAADKVKQGAIAAAKGIKNAVVWIADEAVKLGKLILKYNPLSILIRAGLRIAFRVNLFYMAGRIGHGYFSEAQAQAFGMDMDEWRKCKSQLGKVISLWEGLQGDVDILQESILLGYQSGTQPKIASQPDQGLGGLCGLAGTGLGEPVTATTTAAASGFIATIVAWLKNVDWDKLFKGVKAAAGVVSKMLASFKSVPAVTDTTMLPLSETDYRANQAKYETQNPNAGQSSDLALPLVLGAATVGVMYLTSKDKSK